jgi:hypothetical protein
VTRSSPAVASWRSRLRPRRAGLHGPPRGFRAGPHLLDPPRDGVVVPLEGPPGRYLAGPLVANEQLAYTLNRVGEVEAWPITVFIRTRVQRWSSQPCATGPLASSASSCVNCFALSLGSDADPCDRRVLGPPSSHIRRHRWTDRTLIRRPLAMSSSQDLWMGP